MKSDIETKLEAIVELQNYFMRDLTPFEKNKILESENPSVTVGEIMCKCALSDESKNKWIFDKVKETVSTYFTAPASHWSDLMKNLYAEDSSDKLAEVFRSIAEDLENFGKDHTNDGYSDEKDPDLDKYFNTPKNSSTLQEYVNCINKPERSVDDIFNSLLKGRELELEENEFDKVADKFFSEDREGCWSLSYNNGKVRMTYEK